MYQKVKCLNGRSESGAVFLESAIAIPLLFVVIFGIVEFGRLAYIRASLQSCAADSLGWAETVPDLDLEDSPIAAENAANATRRTVAFNSIKDRLTQKAGSTLGFPFTVSDPQVPGYPTVSGSTTRAELLSSNPLEVTVTGNVPLSFPLSVLISSINIVGKAVGYRELRSYPTMPKAVDCAGNDITVIGTPVSVGCKCPQSNDPSAFWNPTLNKCQCGGGKLFVPPSSGPGSASTPGFCSSSSDPCKASVAECDPAQIILSGTCLCTSCQNNSVANSLRNNCMCPAAVIDACKATPKGFYDPFYGTSGDLTSLNCRCTNCSGDSTRNSTKTGCDCSSGQIAGAVVDNKPLKNDCSPGASDCLSNQIVDSTGKSCVCPVQTGTCTAPLVYDKNSSTGECGCWCPGGGLLINDGTNSGCAPATCKTKSCSWKPGVGFSPDE